MNIQTQTEPSLLSIGENSVNGQDSFRTHQADCKTLPEIIYKISDNDSNEYFFTYTEKGDVKLQNSNNLNNPREEFNIVSKTENKEISIQADKLDNDNLVKTLKYNTKPASNFIKELQLSHSYNIDRTEVLESIPLSDEKILNNHLIISDELPTLETISYEYYPMVSYQEFYHIPQDTQKLANVEKFEIFSTNIHFILEQVKTAKPQKSEKAIGNSRKNKRCISAFNLQHCGNPFEHFQNEDNNKAMTNITKPDEIISNRLENHEYNNFTIEFDERGNVLQGGTAIFKREENSQQKSLIKIKKNKTEIIKSSSKDNLTCSLEIITLLDQHIEILGQNEVNFNELEEDGVNLLNYKDIIMKALNFLRKISSTIRRSATPRNIDIKCIQRLFSDIINYGREAAIKNTLLQTSSVSGKEEDSIGEDTTSVNNEKPYFSSTDLNNAFKKFLEPKQKKTTSKSATVLSDRTIQSELSLNDETANAVDSLGQIIPDEANYIYSHVNPVVNIQLSSDSSSQISLSSTGSVGQINSYDTISHQASTSQEISYKLSNIAKNKMDSILKSYVPTINLWGNDSRKDELERKEEKATKPIHLPGYVLKQKGSNDGIIHQKSPQNDNSNEFKESFMFVTKQEQQENCDNDEEDSLDLPDSIRYIQMSLSTSTDDDEEIHTNNLKKDRKSFF
ncbi:DgyrCDS13145 [Dimorphilus gyrociliatus]|uniref:DgyrCDS13145 n=1 Tax=Dimorphilus gyrociliatus TaxID=2664684 RepID=A0A7I8W9W1_9ANNE|nr:DgyrCDS13145 [Dimorphilus gyrociliatus]